MLMAAENPLLLTEYAARMPIGFQSTVELAETVGASVFDINKRLGFPNRHPLSVSFHGDAFKGVDVVAALDVVDWTRGSHKLNTQTREINVVTAPGLQMDRCRFRRYRNQQVGDRLQQASQLGSARARRQRVVAADADLRPARSASTATNRSPAKFANAKKPIGDRHARQWQKWQDQVKARWNERPMTEARLAHEVWQVIQGEDWVLTANTLKEWVHKVWDFDKPLSARRTRVRHRTQIGISIGVALAHKGTGKLVIDLQPDGDLMFDLGALWTPIKYNIPMLIVMYNNRAYYNDWAHQIHMAHQRGTDPGAGLHRDGSRRAAADLRTHCQRHRLVCRGSRSKIPLRSAPP
jgi:acetolactate synthase-1/2/3 large subunit